MTLPPALHALTAYRRFVTYAMAPDPDRPAKTIKRPTDVLTGHYCNSNLPQHQYDYATAASTGRPVGFVLNQADGFWFLDIDGALEDVPGGQQWSGLATDLCTRLRGAAVEISQSGRGLHIIGRGACPDHACKNVPLGLELYTHERFVALTGTGAQGDAAADLSGPIATIAAEFFPPNPHGEIAGWTDQPVPEWGGPADDAELLKAAHRGAEKSAAGAFGGVTFTDLWTANADKLAAKWPSDKGGYDASMADAALVGHLAYWTGKDHERIRRLMLQSALARPKWEDRPEWLETTIMRATSVVQRVAAPRSAPPPVTVDQAAASGMTLRAGRDILTAAEQIEFFKGCVYVRRGHQIWEPSQGELMERAQFNVTRGGRLFVMDYAGEKTTDSAFDACTQSRVFACPQVSTTCFRPELPSGAIVKEEGAAMVNVYWPIETPRLAGDASPFLNHLAKMLPDPQDQQILLHYMASVLQNPGLKAQWWPVIQGCEGNGKSLIERTMAHAIGTRYSHLVNPEAMAKTGNQFNSWIQGHLYLGVEEIYVNNRRDFLDSFKATVTNDRVPMEGKGTNQSTGDNRLNGLLFTNHKDAVPITVDSRRYAVFYTAQQSAADLIRDGMGGAYFPDLYAWFYGRGPWKRPDGIWHGAAIINDYLRSMPLAAELDPAQLCVRAPATSSTRDALTMSLGSVEQEILEAIEEGRPGFAGGWISSMAMDRLIDQMRSRVPRNKRRDLLASLGYIPHPGLIEGRVNNAVPPDNGKPRLYVKQGHLAANLTEPAAIAKAYSKAQEASVTGEAAARFG